MGKQLVHYGKIVKDNMVKQKRTQKYVMDLLGIVHYSTLEQRFVDARFSYDQLRALKEGGLL